jgi:hypothetical protein
MQPEFEIIKQTLYHRKLALMRVRQEDFALIAEKV